MFISVWCLTCALVQEVGEQTAHDGLVADDQHVALSLQLHDDWLQTLNQVLVGLKRGGEFGVVLFCMKLFTHLS